MERQSNSLNVLAAIYKLYIFFMPFSQFTFINTSSAIVKYFLFSISCFFLYIGLALIIFGTKKLIITPLYRELVVLYAFMVIYSVIAAIVLYIPLGTKYGETTFDAIAGDIVFYFVVLLNIYFNAYCLTYIVEFRSLKKILWADVKILLLLGYIQLGTIFFGGPFSAIYTLLQQIFRLYNVQSVAEDNKGVTFFGSELSAASNLFFVIIPFVISVILAKETRKHERVKAYICMILFFPLFLTSNSSSVKIGLFFTIVMFTLLRFKEHYYKWLFAVANIIGISFVVIWGTDIINKIAINTNEFWYILLGKAFDTSNLSSAMRFSGMKNFLWILQNFPLTGVGNGIQGFFYENNLQPWAYQSPEVQAVIAGKSGVPNGGSAFWTAYLTGFGLIGLFFLWKVIKEYYWSVKCRGIKDSSYYIFICGILVFSFQAWMVIGIKQNLSAMFLLSIPVMWSYKCKLGKDKEGI